MKKIEKVRRWDRKKKVTDREKPVMQEGDIDTVADLTIQREYTLRGEEGKSRRKSKTAPKMFIHTPVDNKLRP